MRPDPTEALLPAIVAALTPAQKAALRWLPEDGCDGAGKIRALNRLLTKGLATFRYYRGPRGAEREYWRLTSLGRRVREAIGDE